jgi:hypothetical protein
MVELMENLMAAKLDESLAAKTGSLMVGLKDF